MGKLSNLLFFIFISSLISAQPFSEQTLDLNDFGLHSSSEQSTTLIKKTSGFHLRIAGYNIAHARREKAGGFKNEVGKLSKLRGIAKLLKEQNIDIVGLTEISKGDLRVLFRNQPKFIAKYLGFNYIYEQNYQKGLLGKLATQGNSIVSRYPIISHTNHKLYRKDSKNEQRSCLEAIIDLGQQRKIKVLAAHLSLKPEESEKQIQQIWKIVNKSDYPVILLGDFNSRPNSARVKWLSKKMQDTTQNLTTTYLNKDGVKIDYQFTYGPWKYGTSKVVGFDKYYSDHGCVINDYWLQTTHKK